MLPCAKIKLAHHAEMITLVGTLIVSGELRTFLQAETYSNSSPLWVKETENDASVSSASGVIVLFTSQFKTRNVPMKWKQQIEDPSLPVKEVT